MSLAIALKAEPQGFIAGINLASKASLTFEEAQEELRKSGVRTTEAYQKQIAVINALIGAHKGDQVATAQLVQQKEALVDQINHLNVAQRRGGRSTRAYSFAVLSLSQGLGDAAQFQHGLAQGLRATANNFEATAQAIAIAARQGKGFKGTMKGIGSALLGPAGVVAAVSALSLGLQIVTARAEEAKKEVGALEDAAKSFVKIEASGEFIKVTPENAPRLVQLAKARRDSLKAQREALSTRAVGKGGRPARLLNGKEIDDLTVSLEAQRTLLKELEEAQAQFVARQQLVDAARADGMPILNKENSALDEQLQIRLKLLRIQQRSVEFLKARGPVSGADFMTQLSYVPDEATRAILQERHGFRDTIESREVRRGGLAGILGGTRHVLTDKLGTTSEKGVVYQFTDAQQAEFDKLVAAQRQAQDEMSISWSGHLNNWTRNFADSINEISNLSADMFGSFSALAQLHFQQSGQENRKYFRNFKRLATLEAVINTATAVTRTYRDTPGGLIAKIAAGSLMASLGGVQIALINRAKMNSNPQGGDAGAISNRGLSSSGGFAGSLQSNVARSHPALASSARSSVQPLGLSRQIAFPQPPKPVVLPPPPPPMRVEVIFEPSEIGVFRAVERAGVKVRQVGRKSVIVNER